MPRVVIGLLAIGVIACATERGGRDDERAPRRSSSPSGRESTFAPQLETASGMRSNVRAPASGAPSAAASWGAGLGLSGIGAGNGEPPFGGSRSGPNGPGVSDQGLTVRGAIAPAAVQDVLRATWPTLRRCYEAALARRHVEGDLDVAFAVAPGGTVTAVRSEGTLRDATAKLCIHRVFEALRFPPVGDEGAEIHAFLSFQAGSR